MIHKAVQKPNYSPTQHQQTSSLCWSAIEAIGGHIGRTRKLEMAKLGRRQEDFKMAPNIRMSVRNSIKLYLGIVEASL